jgi:hypothetical protein
MFKAAALAPDRVQAALTEFRKLNSREAKAAFADYWIGVWAEDFEYAWPMLYELLEIVDKEELYRDPRRVGPGAPGDRSAHGDKASYDSFADYFADRVRHPFERWVELERAHRYAQRYAPDLFDRALSEALTVAERYEQAQGEAAAKHDEAIALADELDLSRKGVLGNGRSRSDIITSTRGTSESYLRRRLSRDRPDLFQKVQGKELTARSAALEAGFTNPTVSIRTNNATSAARTLRKHMPSDVLADLIDILTSKEN